MGWGCCAAEKIPGRGNASYAAAYHSRGKVLIDKDRLDQAIRDFSAAIERRQTFAGAYFHRGRAHHLKKKYLLAIADYSRVLELTPDFAPAYNNRGRAYAMLRKTTEALADLNRAEALAPGDTTLAEIRAGLRALTVQVAPQAGAAAIATP